MKNNRKRAGARWIQKTWRSFRAGGFERLEDRAVPAIVATFSPVGGLLTVFGDNLNNTIEVGRNAAGEIQVNGGAVAVQGGTPTVANTATIQVFGQGGHDTITMNESQGPLPRGALFGGAGDDTITAGSGADQLFGQVGNDTLLGKGGNDLMLGGVGNDVLIGGDGDDQAFGELGDDRMIWNPGDDTDLNEGGRGLDTVEVNGGGGAEQFAVTANGARVRFDRLNPAPFALDIGTIERVVVNMNGGDDSFSATGNLAALIQLTVDGGAGNDTILGSNGVDLLIGGDGDDFIDGQQGSDVALMGAGNDVFQWDPGDGSDVVEGQDGTDTMLFNGSAGAEIFEVSANGSRVRFTRNLGNIVMDLNDVEAIDLNALGGTDTVVVNDLSGTDVTTIDVDLAGSLGGSAGDAAADTVIVNGTKGDDLIDIQGSGTSYSVSGLSAVVRVANSEAANDAFVVNALGGEDGLTATTLPATIVKLTLDGGTGDDVILGSMGSDVLLGGDGDDFVVGLQGNDVALLGAGNDVFQWNPGDGSDVVEGQDGTDEMLFFGSNASENIQITPNGGRVLFFRDVANITMDLNDVEAIEFRALGGADNIVVGDLSGTDLARVDLDLRGSNGGGDGQADSVSVNGTQGADVFGASGDEGGVTVFGLSARVNLFHQEAANDLLTLNGLGGDDVLDASSLEADGIKLTLNGGLGVDVLIGGEGDDTINGGDGNDLALMGAGDDVFLWNPGDDNDTIEGQGGFDTMLFNGANVAENIDISSNGGRVRFFRNIASVLMDLNDVEGINFNALGGADTVVVNDLTGTDVTEINLNLAVVGGGGDGAQDRVVVNGTNGDDVVVVVGSGGNAQAFGLAAKVNVTGAEAAVDQLLINGLNGDDVVEASGLAALAMALVVDLGAGDDIGIGGDGNDTILGGDGDDVLVGGPGLDVLDGGSGDNVVIQ